MEENGSKKPSNNILNVLWTRIATGTTDTIAAFTNSIKKSISLKNVLFVVFGVMLLHLFNVISIPFSPFTSQGRIYVDSPEIYTRERLVNDRYDQDYWLRTQLNLLDKQEIQLISRLSKTELTGRLEITDKKQNEEDGKNKPEQEENTNKKNVPGRLTFNQEFHIIAGIRDMIRQQILENMLDDRHDLTGNSVYGLKFDTTVIPGNNTRHRAFVHVKLKVADTFNLGNGEQTSVGNHIKGYVLNQLNPEEKVDKNLKSSFCTGEKCEEPLIANYQKQEQLYLKWLKNIEKRLNLTENSVSDYLRKQQPGVVKNFKEQVIVKTLNTVLGIPDELLLILNKQEVYDEEEGQEKTEINNAIFSTPKFFMNWVKLPPPWSRFFKISQTTIPCDDKSNAACKDYMWFEVHELHEQLYAFKDSEKNSICVQGSEPPGEYKNTNESIKPCGEMERRVDLIPVSEVDNGAWTLYLDYGQLDMREGIFGMEESATPQYKLCSEAIDKLQIIYGDRIEVRSGFFNFVEKLSLVDAYSYAMFPKNEMVGVLDEISMNLKALIPGTGILGIGQQQNTSKTASALVGYGDGSRSGPYREKEADSIAFGWVVSPHGSMEPVQKNQLALVSVPAWTDKLNLTVYMGWLDNESNPTGEPEKFCHDVSVPPDYEAFDTIFREDSWVTHKPRIQEENMDKEIYVKSGISDEFNETVKILIPGTRLWRSTSVTLGGQQADRIRVLPNMKGIIAEFNTIDLPYSSFDRNKTDKICAEKKGLASRPVTLRIWTSEGTTSANDPVCVYYNPKKLGITE